MGAGQSISRLNVKLDFFTSSHTFNRISIRGHNSVRRGRITGLADLDDSGKEIPPTEREAQARQAAWNQAYLDANDGFAPIWPGDISLAIPLDNITVKLYGPTKATVDIVYRRVFNNISFPAPPQSTFAEWRTVDRFVDWYRSGSRAVGGVADGYPMGDINGVEASPHPEGETSGGVAKTVYIADDKADAHKVAAGIAKSVIHIPSVVLHARSMGTVSGLVANYSMQGLVNNPSLTFAGVLVQSEKMRYEGANERIVEGADFPFQYTYKFTLQSRKFVRQVVKPRKKVVGQTTTWYVDTVEEADHDGFASFSGPGVFQ